MTDAPGSLLFERIIPASPAEVFEAWTQPGIIRQWLAPGENHVIEAHTDVRVGGAFLIKSAAPDGVVHTIRGVYRELQPAQRIAMTWSYSGPVELLCHMETLLEIDLSETADGSTAMTVRQSHIASRDAADAYAGGWPTCFDKLDKALGAPAREKQK